MTGSKIDSNRTLRHDSYESKAFHPTSLGNREDIQPSLVR
jgi:hypothetical protein